MRSKWHKVYRRFGYVLKEKIIDKGGKGWEIDKEIKLCQKCFEGLNNVNFRSVDNGRCSRQTE